MSTKSNMQITAFLSTLLAATAIASPTYNGGGGGGGSPYVACSPGLYSTAQCCATDVLGVADLDCASRKFWNLINTLGP